MRVIILLALCCAASAAPKTSQRIVGGSLATISQYPSIASLLYSGNLISYSQTCGGSIINIRSVLTAANCVYRNQSPSNWRVRVGSSFANSGGTVYSVEKLTVHSNYSVVNNNNDVAIMRTATNISYVNNAVAPASIAGSNYNIADNSVVWAAGWGRTSYQGNPSEQLRHVQVWTVNQNTCVRRYAEVGSTVTENMLCSGWIDVGGRDQCQGDSGGPLYHNGVVVGIASWGYQCGLARYPGVNTRVSRYSSWIVANA